jgi:erythronate-4-phosphate dehydrogenase
VAEWGHKLGFRILVNDPPLCAAQPQIAAQYPYEFVSLEELLKESDVVTLHTPLTKEGPHATFHLIASPQVSLMKHGATLINAARGPVIDTEAVIEAMHTRGIHAFIDTWEGEPDRLNLTLLHEADIATFHVAGYSLQGKQRATRMACEALARHFGLKGVKLDDLPQPYTPVKHISEAEIVDSYNPLADTESLRKDPSQFEHLRDNYQYRSEPEFVAEK